MSVLVLILLSSIGKATRLKASDISIIGRATQGVRLIKLKEGEKLVGLEQVDEPDDELINSESGS